MSKANYKFDSCAYVCMVRIDACECVCVCVCVLGLGVYTTLKKVKKVNLKKCPGLVHTYYRVVRISNPGSLCCVHVFIYI